MEITLKEIPVGSNLDRADLRETKLLEQQFLEYQNIV